MEGNSLQWRVGHLETQIEKLDSEKADLRDLNNVAEQMRTLSGEVKSLRSALLMFALTVAGSAIVFAFAVMQLVGDK